MIKLIRAAILSLTTLLLLTACQEANQPVSQTDTTPDTMKAAAIVNGKIISEQELKDRLEESQAKLRKRNPNLKQHMEQTALKVMVQKELAAQKALELGLDTDPAYLEQMQRITARFNSFKRDRLAELFEAKEIKAKAEPTDSDVDKFIAANEVRIRSESRILQLMQRSEEKIQEISKQLAAGKTFDEVATELFPKLPEEMKRPWDMGYLNWDQIPDAWTAALADLKPGQTSAIIPGPKNRYWIIHLVDRRVNEAIDMDAQKDKITQILRADKLSKLREQTMQALQDSATIIYPERESLPEAEPDTRPELYTVPDDEDDI